MRLATPVNLADFEFRDVRNEEQKAEVVRILKDLGFKPDFNSVFKLPRRLRRQLLSKKRWHNNAILKRSEDYDVRSSRPDGSVFVVNRVVEYHATKGWRRYSRWFGWVEPSKAAA